MTTEILAGGAEAAAAATAAAVVPVDVGVDVAVELLPPHPASINAPINASSIEAAFFKFFFCWYSMLNSFPEFILSESAATQPEKRPATLPPALHPVNMPFGLGI